LKNNPRALFEIHFAVFLFGLSGLIGKMISLPPMLIVFGRSFFAMVTIALILKLGGRLFIKIQRSHFLVILLTGVILAFHWFCFFYSIHISTVAIGLLTFSSFPIFVTFMEPIFFHEKLKLRDILLAFMVVIGLTLTVPAFDMKNQVTLGIIWGILAGFTFAILSLLNRTVTKFYSSIHITLIQNSAAAIVLMPAVFLSEFQIKTLDYFLIPVLGIFCTALSFGLFVKSLKSLTAKTVALIMSLEPIYGIILATVIIHEIPTQQTVIGGIIILGAVAIESMIQGRQASVP
jgi:drug/metabolite transporter (DMT)-like permease